MNSFSRVIIVFSCLVLAFICYGQGISSGAILLVILGGVFEMCFWLGIFNLKPKKASNSSTK